MEFPPNPRQGTLILDEDAPEEDRRWARIGDGVVIQATHLYDGWKWIALKDFKPHALESTDAREWAEEFVKHVSENPAIATDVPTMTGWFANSIEVGRRAGKED